jgi:chitin disaccharide deacetylase
VHSRLIVCADDYGFTPGVSRAIRELLAARRISATSVMAASEFWPTEAPALKAVAAGADIGLHVTLTDHVPLGPMPAFAHSGRFPTMGTVYKTGMTRKLPLDEIGAEIERQITSFVMHFGAAPAHIDGHHHIHQLPGIRDIVVDAAKRLAPGRTWVRSCREPPLRILRRGVAVGKALAIGALGAGIDGRARRAGVPVNRGFSGAYDFLADKRPASELFQRFVANAGDNALVMCHPGHSDATLAKLDVMTTAREAELAYLMSPDWPALLAKHRLELGPLRRAP